MFCCLLQGFQTGAVVGVSMSFGVFGFVCCLF